VNAPVVKPKSTPHSSGPLIVVKRDEQEFEDWAATEIGFLTSFGSYQDAQLDFEPYQIHFLKSSANYRCIEKSRQVGYSWVFACEATARSHLRDAYTAVFVSYNLADAKEKIAYCQQLHEDLPLEYQKKKVVDSKLEIAFQSNGGNRRVSRIISNPSKAPRGKKGDIYLDELAHCANDREIYKGSTALILRSAGQLTVCSSPLGRRGVFWEIARQEIRPYRAYKRQRVPWWLCSFFCTDVRRAALEAPKLTTEERVRRYGKPGIIEQFESLLLEDFQQEFEVVYSDETLTFFPYPLIMPCTDAELELATDFAELEKCKGRLLAGFDVGRKRDLSELAIFEEVRRGEKVVLECRMLKEYDRVAFRDQEADLRLMLSTLPVVRLSIDNNGIGMNLAENLRADFPQVVAEDFTTTTKERWCTDFKIGLQRREIILPRERSLIAQIHSIKKNVTAGGRVTFDTEKDSSTKGHADKFWACALAVQKERGELLQGPGGVRVRIIGAEEQEAAIAEALAESLRRKTDETRLRIADLRLRVPVLVDDETTEAEREALAEYEAEREKFKRLLGAKHLLGADKPREKTRLERLFDVGDDEDE
jgi:phage FluMu gp28-like protein